jgi:ubiquinone/menaquinone biosynthesis C-methylase UbiE
MIQQNMNFWTMSYNSHIENELNTDNNILESWKRLDTVDAWRHKRMYDNLLPLIEEFPDANWLTVGDGRYGTDSNFLLRNGVKRVLTTNISDHLIKRAKLDGFIQDYAVENAERLSFSDESFDFVLCKESYHHFPRPMLAIYEMLRVAREGIVLIEPNDRFVEPLPSKTVSRNFKNRILLIKEFCKQMIGISLYKRHFTPEYEETGNYIFSVSEREIEKVALGLNLPFITFKGLNDIYRKGVEFEQANETSEIFREIRKEISKKDKLSRQAYSRYKLLIIIILKVNPSIGLLNKLQTNNFRNYELPRNPYNL